MLLKKIVLTLLVANLGYAVYSQGWLSALTGADARQREPERLQRQINASAIKVHQEMPNEPKVLPTAQPVMEAKVGVPTTCANAATPAEEWRIYMGPYASKELLAKKKTELAKLKVTSVEVAKTSLPRGLSLGQYASESEARSALEALQKKGVKTATVLLWTSATQDSNC